MSDGGRQAAVRRDLAVVGAAGEHYVLFRLHQHGLIAALAPPGAHQADIIVFSPEMSVGSMVQVKTRTRGSDGGWQMSEKHEGIVHDRLFYAFVDLEPAEPIVYVVPSAIVAEVVGTSHCDLAGGTWRRRSGATGQQDPSASSALLMGGGRIRRWLARRLSRAVGLPHG